MQIQRLIKTPVALRIWRYDETVQHLHQETTENVNGKDKTSERNAQSFILKTKSFVLRIYNAWISLVILIFDSVYYYFGKSENKTQKKNQ